MIYKIQYKANTKKHSKYDYYTIKFAANSPQEAWNKLKETAKKNGLRNVKILWTEAEFQEV